MGMPFTNTMARNTQVRLRWMRETENINESDWLQFDACRHASQCLGRAIRGKDDYAMLVMADKRFSRNDRLKKMPSWLTSRIEPSMKDMSIDECTREARVHMKSMGIDEEEVKTMGFGVSLLSQEQIAKDHVRKMCLTKITEIE